VRGSGFGSSETVDFTVDTQPVGSVTADPTGAFTARFRVPRLATPGTYTVTATGETSGLTASASFLVRTDWPKFHFDLANSGRNPFENVLSTANVGTMGAQWNFPTGGAVSSSPAVAQGVLYVGSNDFNLYALDASTGAKLWSFPTGSQVRSSPAVANGVVYVGSLDFNVYALSASTGVKLWSYTTGSAVESSPAVANGVVYVGSGDSNVYALSASTGAQLWSFTAGSGIAGVAVANGVLYVGSFDHNVYALNAVTGAELWTYTTGDVVMSSPAVASGVVYVGSNDSNLYALSASTGAELWSFAAGAGIYTSPAVANGVAYVAAADNSVYALNASTGAELWSYATGNVVESSPAIANGVVYVGSDDHSVYALNASTGAKLWSYGTGSAVTSSPAVANGAVYVGSFDNGVYAFSLACGTFWSTQSSPNIAGAYNHLQGVDAISSTDVWAVGSSNGVNATQPLAEHWDGAAWTIVPVPRPGDPNGYGPLWGVSGVASDDVWAVGYYFESFSSSTALPLAYHWDGTSWTQVPMPVQPNHAYQLFGVTAISSNDVWAVGLDVDLATIPFSITMAMHWDGTSWTVVPTANPNEEQYLQSVAAISSNDVWAVGSKYNNNSQPQYSLIEHWDGTSWTEVSAPNPGGTGFTQLAAVSGTAPNDVWAAGSYAPLGQTGLTLAIRWDGATWTQVPTESPGADNNYFGIGGVAAVNADDVIAVGVQMSHDEFKTHQDTLIQRWDGTSFTTQASPNPGYYNTLMAVSALPSGAAWAVGYQYNFDTWLDEPLIESISGCSAD